MFSACSVVADIVGEGEGDGDGTWLIVWRGRGVITVRA